MRSCLFVIPVLLWLVWWWSPVRVEGIEPEAAGLRLNVNTATAGELEVLPGVGPTISGNIVAYREAYGAFRSVDELDEVSRIGPKTVEKLRPWVGVE